MAAAVRGRDGGKPSARSNQGNAADEDQQNDLADAVADALWLHLHVKPTDLHHACAQIHNADSANVSVVKLSSISSLLPDGRNVPAATSGNHRYR